MAAPSTAITRLDLSMSVGEFNSAANRRGFVAMKVLPPVIVAKDAGDFPKLKAEQLIGPVEDTERAAKSGYARDDFTWTTDSFATKENGVEEVVDDQTIERYGDVLRAEAVHAVRGTNRLLNALEQKAATAIFNTGTWTGDALTTAVGTAWNDTDDSLPVDNIDDAADKVQDNCGSRANAIIIPAKLLRKWARTDQVRNQVKLLRGDDAPMGALIQAMKDVQELEYVFVADGVKNTKNKGQAAEFTRFWDPTKCMVFHHSPNDSDLEDPVPTLGKTILFQPQVASLPGDDSGEGVIIVEEYREEQRRGGVLRYRMGYQQKILLVQVGHLLTGCL